MSKSNCGVCGKKRNDNDVNDCDSFDVKGNKIVCVSNSCCEAIKGAKSDEKLEYYLENDVMKYRKAKKSCSDKK